MRKPDRKIKRIFDLVACICALPVVVPLCAVLAVLVSLGSSGSPIYKQERIGRDGKKFTLYKFRTMVKNADRQLEKYLKNNPQMASEWKKTQKLHNDPRVTKIGHFLRKSSLDELPQIFNILKGDMSLVGPRPIVDSEIEKYGKMYSEYCEMTPGLTGLWQVSGRNDATYDRRLACDHYYLHNWSLKLDLMIILKTIPVAFQGFGAY